jgi:Mpv17-like protein
MLRSTVRSARQLVARSPVITNTLMYGSLYTLAEVSQQKVSARLALEATKPKHLDTCSVKRYAIMGTFVFPPLLTRWYAWLDTRFPATSGPVVMKKLLLDQFLLTPFVVAIFYVGMAWLEGKPTLEELRQKGLRTFFLDCCFWLPVQVWTDDHLHASRCLPFQLANFMFVPPLLRVAVIGAATFVWLNILAYVKARPSLALKDLLSAAVPALGQK